jgi:dimethylglycine dehydrogenase
MMKSHAKVVVIGGGVVGCSVAYHLSKFGWKDVVLLERAELTSGSTWHAAGGMHTINGDPNVAKLQKYTVELYREIEQASGQSVGLHLTGGIMLAATKDRFDWMKTMLGKGKYLGLDAQLISPSEAVELMPILDPSQFVGAVHDKLEGHLDPYGTTHAYAKAAKLNGAEIHTHTKVEDLQQQDDGQWRVVTTKGDIIAEHVVNAGGLWAREVGRMVGLELPVLAMEHHYLLTEEMPEVVEFNQRTAREMLHAVDFDGELYLRQEGKGMLLGTYEKACKPWSPKVTPWDFGQDLLEPDLERIAPSLEVGFRHFPAFAKAGIRKIVNGPFTFAPDGNPLVGPVKGMRGFWCACAVMAGFSQGGGVGLALANWMIEGDPGFDVFGMDVSRFGSWATLAYTNKKVSENYSRRFSIRFPNEELPAGRPLMTTPVHDMLAAKGAQFGTSYGLEVPLWFAPAGLKEEFKWRRSNDFPHIAAEVKAVREAVGICDISGYAKYRVTGPGAEAWLDKILACKLPSDGRMTLAPMLKDDGRVIGDFTLARLGADWFIVGSGPAEDYHMRWFLQHLPKDGSVQISAHGQGLSGLSIAGPKARELLSRVTDTDVSNQNFPFMSIRNMVVGMAPVLVGRVSYTGDLGYELWMEPQYQRHVYLTLQEAGVDLGLKDFGYRALNSLRFEKNYGSWGREYRPIYTAVEAGLDRFVALNKPAGFIGKAAAQGHAEDGGKLRLIALEVAARDSDALGDEPVFFGSKVVGWVTSGGYAHHSGKSVALAYVDKELATRDDGFEVEILGEMFAAKRLPKSLFDPEYARMRG